MLEARNPVALLITNANGDHLLNLPALRALAELFAGRLALVCTAGARERFFSALALRACAEVRLLHETADGEREGRPRATKVFDFAGRVSLASVLDVERVAISVGESCDLLLSLDTNPLPATVEILRRLSPARSVGFAPYFGVALQPDFDKHAFDLAFELPRLLNPALRSEDFASPPIFPPTSHSRAAEVRAGLPAGFKILAVHADTKREKMWAAERMSSLLGKYLKRHPDFIAVLIGTEDLGLGAGAAAARVFPCFGLSVMAAMALVGEADLFLGVDSCMLHAADLYRVPGVGLFGPTSPRQWGFRFGPHRHVWSRGAMDAIREDEVLDALESLCEETAERPEDAGRTPRPSVAGEKRRAGR